MPATQRRAALVIGDRFRNIQTAKPRGGAAQPDTKSQVQQGYLEKSNVSSVAEMSRMIQVTRTYTQISTLLQQESDLHKSAIEKLADVPA